MDKILSVLYGCFLRGNHLSVRKRPHLLTFCCELGLAAAAAIGDALVSRVVGPGATVVNAGCCMATVEIFWPKDVITTGTCIATRTVLLTSQKNSQHGDKKCKKYLH